MSVKEKRLVESVLFSASKPVSVSEIMNATALSRKKVKDTLAELIQDYNIKRKSETSMEVVKAGDKYAMQLKEKFSDQQIKIATPEIDSELLKTLTLIAFHQPLKQSNLRRMIGQKTYEQVQKLVSHKLVSARSYKSTLMLSTTKLFPEYFGIDSTNPEDIKNFLMQKVGEKVSKKQS